MFKWFKPYQRYRNNQWRAKDLQRRLEETPAVVFHSKYTYKLPPKFLLPVTSAGLLGRDEGLDERVCVVSIHNYTSPPILDRSLEYVNYRNRKTISYPQQYPWANSRKLILLREFLVTECDSEYVLYIDANDGVLCRPPAQLIPHIRQLGCEILFSATEFRSGYEYMEEMGRWWEGISGGTVYLNAGVFFGQVTGLIRLLESALEFATDDDLSPTQFSSALESGTLKELCPTLPYGVGSDQFSLRFLLREFYPMVQVDMTETLALNRPTVFNWGP